MHVIGRILLLPWMELIMIKVIESYETNGHFLVFRSVKSLVSLSSVQIKINLMFSVCFYHVTYAFQAESTLYSCLNVKGLLA